MNTNYENHRVYKMSFSSIYNLYVQKVERKGRTQKELDEVIMWLTGYSKSELDKYIKSDSDIQTFFENASKLNPNRDLITGVICGVRVEEIDHPLMKLVRQLDKLVDELAKGKELNKILRQV